MKGEGKKVLVCGEGESDGLGKLSRYNPHHASHSLHGCMAWISGLTTLAGIVP